jgi:hypothetical protein
MCVGFRTEYWFQRRSSNLQSIKPVPRGDVARGTPSARIPFCFAMRVLRDTFAIFTDGGFLVALTVILAFEAAFAGLMLVLTSS